MSKGIQEEVIALIRNDLSMHYKLVVLTTGAVMLCLNSTQKQPISVNRVVPIPTTEAIIDTVNNIAAQEQQPEGVEFSDMHGRITLQDFADNDNDGDSNASDEDFELDEGYEEEVNDEIRLEKEDGSVGNDCPDLQEDYFQNPIQQHEANIHGSNEAVSSIIPRAKQGSNIPLVLLTDMATAETQKCGEQKKRKLTTMILRSRKI
jgi:hypothetical protein